MQIGMERRAAVAGTIDDIDFVAFLKQVSRPTAPAIGSAHPIGALSAAAVHQHDRVRMANPRRYLILDVHLLAIDYGAAGEFSALDADPEIAPFGDVER